MRWTKLLRSMLVVPLVVAVLVSVGAAPASAQASGCGFLCDDKDPDSFWVAVGQYDGYNCSNDAITVAVEYENVAYPQNGGSIELRYSPRCRTAWARGGPHRYIWVERKSPHRVEDATGSTLSQSGVWTRMVNDAGMVSRACQGNPEMCTAWY
jgi:hypothetical protein